MIIALLILNLILTILLYMLFIYHTHQIKDDELI